jgi:hypothetical protein
MYGPNTYLMAHVKLLPKKEFARTGAPIPLLRDFHFRHGIGISGEIREGRPVAGAELPKEAQVGNYIRYLRNPLFRHDCELDPAMLSSSFSL